MDWLWYVIPVVITAVVFYFKLRRQVQFKENMPVIAASLGLKFYDRADLLPEYIARDARLPTAMSDPENVEKIQKYAKVISRWRMDGERNGVKVRVYPRAMHHGHRNQSTYTRLEALFEQPKALGMKISSAGNMELGRPEIKVEGLSRKIIVKSEDEARAQQLLSDPGLQHAIASAFEFSSEMVVDDTGARLDKHGPPPLDVDYYRQALDLLTRVISAFEHRIR